MDVINTFSAKIKVHHTKTTTDKIIPTIDKKQINADIFC